MLNSAVLASILASSSSCFLGACGAAVTKGGESGSDALECADEPYCISSEDCATSPCTPEQTAECLALGDSDPSYPGTYTRTGRDVSNFEEPADRFRQTFASDDIEFYVVEPRPATASPYIMSESSNENRGIRLAGDWSDATSAAKLEDFAQSWEEFFNPYGSVLVDEQLGCDDELYCGYDRMQTVCGLRVRQLENHFYQGSFQPQQLRAPPVRHRRQRVRRDLASRNRTLRARRHYST